MASVTILEEIERLQKKEETLYNQLKEGDDADTMIKNTNIISKINRYTNRRNALFSRLKKIGHVYNKTIDINESTLNDHKENMNSLKSMRNNKLRLITINTYYGKKYLAYSGLIQVILLFCVCLLILAILMKFNLLPNRLFNVFVMIVIFIGFMYTYYVWNDISSRSNNDFDKYEWKSTPGTIDTTIYDISGNETEVVPEGEESLSDTLAQSLGYGCIGEGCCSEGTVYDETISRCIDSDSNNENFDTANYETQTSDQTEQLELPWKETEVLPYDVEEQFANV